MPPDPTPPPDPSAKEHEMERRCERCGQELTGGSHWHCGGCDSTEETSMLGHLVYGVMTCHMTQEERWVFIAEQKTTHRV